MTNSDNFEIQSIRYARNLHQEVENAAKWMAEHGYEGKQGEPLPDLLSGRAFTRINNDLYAFQLRIRRAKEELDRTTIK